MSNNTSKSKSISIAIGIFLLFYVGSYIAITRYSYYVNRKLNTAGGITFVPLNLLTENNSDMFDFANMCGYYFYFPIYWLDNHLIGTQMVDIMYDLG